MAPCGAKKLSGKKFLWRKTKGKRRSVKSEATETIMSILYLILLYHSLLNGHLQCSASSGSNHLAPVKHII